MVLSFDLKIINLMLFSFKKPKIFAKIPDFGTKILVKPEENSPLGEFRKPRSLIL